MRKFFLLQILIGIAFLFSCVGCLQNDSKQPDEGKKSEELPTLSKKIPLTNAGTSIDVAREISPLSENEELTVNKALTITSSGTERFDMKGAVIRVTKSGVVLKNLQNITEIIVEASVASGDFAVENCLLDEIKILGGGSKSIRFSDSLVKKAVADYDNVHIILKNSRVFFLRAAQSFQLDSPDTYSTVDAILIDKTVEHAALSQMLSIVSLCTKSDDDEGSRPVVLIQSSSVTIVKTADKAKDGTLRDCNLFSVGEVPDVFTLSLLEDEVTAMEKMSISTPDEIANYIEETESEAVVVIDNPGPLHLTRVSDGLELAVQIPEKTNRVRLYRSEYGKETWDCIAFCQTLYGIPFSQSICYTDRFTESGKTYSYYAEYLSSENGNVIEKSETDSITATAGALPEMPETELTLNYGANMRFALDGADAVTAALGADKEWGWLIFFKGAQEKTASLTADERAFTTLFLDKNKTPNLCFADIQCIGTSLEVAAAYPVNLRSEENILYSTLYPSLEVLPGESFTDDTVVFEPSAVPFSVALGDDGLQISVDCGKIDFSEPIQSIDVAVYRDYTASLHRITPVGEGHTAISGAAFSFKESWVTKDEVEKLAVSFRKENDDASAENVLLTVGVWCAPSSGFGAPSFSSDVALERYNSFSQTGYVEKDVSSWFKKGNPLSETYEISIDQVSCNLTREKILLCALFRSVDGITKRRALFSPLAVNMTTVYVLNLYNQLYETPETELVPYGAEVGAAYENTAYHVDYYPYRSALTPISSPLSTVTVGNPFSGKSFALPGGDTISFSDVTKSGANVTVTSGEGETVVKSGKVDFSTNTIVMNDEGFGPETWCFGVRSKDAAVIARPTLSKIFVREDSRSTYPGSKWSMKAGDTNCQYVLGTGHFYEYKENGVMKRSGSWSSAYNTIEFSPSAASESKKIVLTIGNLMLTDVY